MVSQGARHGQRRGDGTNVVSQRPRQGIVDLRERAKAGSLVGQQKEKCVMEM